MWREWKRENERFKAFLSLSFLLCVVSWHFVPPLWEQLESFSNPPHHLRIESRRLLQAATNSKASDLRVQHKLAKASLEPRKRWVKIIWRLKIALAIYCRFPLCWHTRHWSPSRIMLIPEDTVCALKFTVNRCSQVTETQREEKAN